MQVCEADNEVCRIKEELPLLLKEMMVHTRYWKGLIGQQQQLERAMQAAVQLPGNASALLQAAYQVWGRQMGRTATCSTVFALDCTACGVICGACAIPICASAAEEHGLQLVQC